jgi:hypothetical protein
MTTLTVALHGREVEVPRAALEAELLRDGAIASLALVEAIARHAPRDVAIARLARALDALSGTIGLTTLLALARLHAIEALPRLRALEQPGPLGLTARVIVLLLDGALVSALDDDALLVRAPLVLTTLQVAPRETPAIVTALLRGVDRLQSTLGVTAYRALLGDVAEALFRLAQRGADLALGDQRDTLVDRLSSELPGTPDLVAARGMAWLLGVLAQTDDAAVSAIERARDRFRDPAFHDDCTAILDGRWPPRVG